MKVSIITSHYNQNRYVGECISSVSSREHDLEHVIIDALSNDGSRDIINRMRHDKMIAVFEKDSGQAEGLNKGFKLASGDVLGFMNGDDYYLPGGIDKLVSLMERENLDFAYGGQINLDCSGGFASVSVPDGSEAQQIGNFSTVFEPACLWRRKVWEEVGPFNSEKHYTFGWDFIAKVVRSGKFKVGHLDDVVTVNRLHPERKTSNHNATRESEIREHIGEFGDADHQDLSRIVTENRGKIASFVKIRPSILRKRSYPLVFPILSRRFKCDDVLRMARTLS
jgi:glycosyltransferase involved in cell wall biosynthesis